MLNELLPIASPIITIIALIFAFNRWRGDTRASRFIQHYNLVSMSDSMIADNKDVLRFHGIDLDTLEEYGVTSSDLCYLVQSFNSGSISDILSDGKDGKAKRHEKGGYWYDILRNAPTQRAFPLVKRLFDSNNHFIARCEETISYIKNIDQKA